MSTSKHPNAGSTAEDFDRPDDLERNPGIGQSAGTTAAGESPLSIEGENTVEGDLENDTTPNGAVRRDSASEANRA
jgi:hypothetical protein